MSVAFRVDGGSRLGMGHVNRCLSVARYLNHKAIKCYFLVSNPSIIQVASPYGKVVQIKQSSEVQEINRFLTIEGDCKVLVIDSKRDAITKVLTYANKRIKTVLIDNIDHYKNCDLVILPGVAEQFATHPDSVLIGSKYVMLNPSFKLFGTSRYKKNNHILFSAGSTDKFDITNRVISAFKSSNRKFQMTVVLGRFYKHIERIKDTLRSDPRFHILVDPHNFSKLLVTHSLGIVTFGITIYEAAAAGLPVLVISHSKENDISARRLEKYSWMKYMGKYDSVNYDEMVDNTLSLLNEKELLKEMSESGKIIDGRGAERVGKAIISLMKGNDPLKVI